MQASNDKPTIESDGHELVQRPEEEVSIVPSQSVEQVPTEPFIPHFLEPQQEDNISIDMIKLYQVMNFFIYTYLFFFLYTDCLSNYRNFYRKKKVMIDVSSL